MRRPTTILFTIPNFITAGSGRAMLNIIERLDRERFSPAVCVMKKGGDLDNEVNRLGIPFLEAPFAIPAKPFPTLMLRANRVARQLRGGHFVLWHSFHYADDYTEPIIAHLSGARAWVYTKKNMNWSRRSWYLRTLLAARVVAQNRDMMKQFFSHRLFASKARLLPRGVDTDKFSPETPARLQLRAQLGIPHDAIVVGCVGDLARIKGHSALLKAIAGVPQTYAVIAGKTLDNDYRAELDGLVQNLGIADRVRFLGGVRDVPALLAEMELFVLPTAERGEGCPVALLEALSSGCACIATDVPGSRDLIEHGKSGIIVPAGDCDSLTKALAQLASSTDDRQTLGEAARQRVVQHFSIQKEVAAHQALYDETLS